MYIYVYIYIYIYIYIYTYVYLSDLSINLLRAGAKSPMRRGFFNNIAAHLLPALSFLDGLYNLIL